VKLRERLAALNLNGAADNLIALFKSLRHRTTDDINLKGIKAIPILIYFFSFLGKPAFHKTYTPTNSSISFAASIIKKSQSADQTSQFRSSKPFLFLDTD
jgi:hypothetical protein